MTRQPSPLGRYDDEPTPDVALHEVLPEGVDVPFDGLGGAYLGQCVRATKRGGIVVGYGFSAFELTPTMTAYAEVAQLLCTQLADEARQRGIVASISPRQVGRFLKYGRTAAAS